MSTPSCFCDRPKARRSSCSSWAGDCGERRTRRSSRCSTSSATTARSSASTSSCGPSPVTPALASSDRFAKAFPSSHPGARSRWIDKHRSLVLENIRSQIANRWQQIVAELRRHADADLGGFLEESGIELSDILRRGSHSWTRLRRDAGLPTAPGSELEAALLKRVRAFAHVDDRDRAMAYARLLDDDAPAYDELSATEQRLARMLFNSLWSDGGGFTALRTASQPCNAKRLPAARSRQLLTCPSRPPVTSPSTWPVRSGATPAQGARAVPARGDPRRLELPAQPQQLPRGRLVLRASTTSTHSSSR